MEKRFQKNYEETTDFKLFIDPFTVAIKDVAPEFQLELINLQTSVIEKRRHNNEDIDFYRGLDNSKFPKIVDNAQKIASLFGSTYICESTFSFMKLTKSRLRSRLTDEHLRDILRTATSSIGADIELIVKDKKCNTSH